jgi:CheY-like chemotaxis protein
MKSHLHSSPFFYESTILPIPGNRRNCPAYILFILTILFILKAVVFPVSIPLEDGMPVPDELTIHPGESTMSPVSGRDDRSALMGYVAHEFNNLFAGLLLNLSAARLAIESPAEALHYLERAEAETARGRTSIRLLSILADRTPPDREVIPAAHLMDFLTAGTGESPAIFRVPRDIPPLRIAADREGLALVIRSLAGRITGGVRADGMDISIEEKPVSGNGLCPLPEGRYARLALEYHGSGIAGNVSECPFQASGGDADSGMDLAFAACQALIRRHGGFLRRVYRGQSPSGFAIYLPAVQSGKRNSFSEPAQETQNRGRILLMDDEESIRTIAEILFGKLGYDITTVSDGASAVDAYRTAMDEGRPYRVVIMDLIVPFGMGGREAMQILREINPDIRAVVSSGYTTDSVMEKFRDYGFSAAVEKPYRLETLLEIVQQLLKTG